MRNNVRMAQTLKIQLEKGIASVELVEQGDVGRTVTAQDAKVLKTQKEDLGQACQALQNTINKVDDFQENLFKGHKEQIAKLSVEIARKILVQKVQDGDYEIESIIEEALKNAPTREDLVVHLNPEDLAECQKALEDNGGGMLAGIKLVSDSNVGRAECILDSPKGMIKSLIEEHLDQISKTLKKAE